MNAEYSASSFSAKLDHVLYSPYVIPLGDRCDEVHCRTQKSAQWKIHFLFLFTIHHLSILLPAYPVQGRGAWSLSYPSLGESQGTRWTSDQSVTGLTHTETEAK